jgi:hypothetical protein
MGTKKSSTKEMTAQEKLQALFGSSVRWRPGLPCPGYPYSQWVVTLYNVNARFPSPGGAVRHLEFHLEKDALAWATAVKAAQACQEVCVRSPGPSFKTTSY